MLRIRGGGLLLFSLLDSLILLHLVCGEGVDPRLARLERRRQARHAKASSSGAGTGTSLQLLPGPVWASSFSFTRGGGEAATDSAHVHTCTGMNTASCPETAPQLLIAGLPLLLVDNEQAKSQVHASTVSHTVRTSASVWDGGVVLARYLEAYSNQLQVVLGADTGTHRDTAYECVELGSGTGVGGIAAAMLGWRVLLTDVGDVVPLLRANVALNSEAIRRVTGQAQVVALDWTSTQDLERVLALGTPRLLLASDVVWVEGLIAPLLGVIDKLCGPDTLLLLSYQQRSVRATRMLFEGLEQHGFLHRECPFEEYGHMSAVKIFWLARVSGSLSSHITSGACHAQ